MELFSGVYLFSARRFVALLCIMDFLSLSSLVVLAPLDDGHEVTRQISMHLRVT